MPALADKPKLLSVMRANNETGVLQDVVALAAAARPTGAWFHTDAAQALGKLPLSFRDLNAAGVHAMTVSAHKIGGPKGAAALVLDKRVELAPLIAGGGHERGLRSGHRERAGNRRFRALPRNWRRRGSQKPGRDCARCRHRWRRACWRSVARLLARRRAGCRIPAISRSPASTARPWSASWIVPVLRCRQRRGSVPAPIRSLRTCCRRWAWRRKPRAARCGSASGGTTARQIEDF